MKAKLIKSVQMHLRSTIQMSITQTCSNALWGEMTQWPLSYNGGDVSEVGAVNDSETLQVR